MQQQPTHPDPAQPLFSERFTSAIPASLPRPSEFYWRLLHFHGSCSYDAQRLIYPNDSLDMAEIAELLPDCIGQLVEILQEDKKDGETLDQVIDVPSIVLNFLGDIALLGLVAEASWRTYQQCDTDKSLSQVFETEFGNVLNQTLKHLLDDTKDTNLSGIFAALDTGAVVLNEIFTEIAPPPTHRCGSQPCLNCQSYQAPSVKE